MHSRRHDLMAWGRALLRDRRMVWLAVAAAFALRAWYGLRLLPRDLVGDESWYATTASQLVEHGLGGFGDAGFIRPPGTTFYVALVYLVAGVGNVAAVVLANAAVSAGSTALVAAIARAVLPHRKWAPVLLAWVHVLHPSSLFFAGSILSESVSMPLTLLFAWACVRGWETLTWRGAVAIGVTGALLLHVRADCLLLVLAAPPWAILSAWRRKSCSRRFAGRWAAGAVLALLLCVPWSQQVSRQVGEPAFLFHSQGNEWVHGNSGLGLWLSGVSLPEREWVQLLWFPQWAGKRELPQKVFDTPEEESEVRALLARAVATGDLGPADNERFRELGAARRARRPLRFYVGLPLERSVRIWLDVTIEKYAWPGETPPYSARERAAQVLRRAYAVLLALGFLCALVFLFRLREAQSLLALLVLVRTYGFLIGGTVLTGIAPFESRYVCNGESLVLVLLAGAVAAVLQRRPSSARGSPAPG